jgi:adenine-specific DNA-methyltransferase
MTDGPQLHWTGKRALAEIPDPPTRLEHSFGPADAEAPDELYRGDALEVLGHLLRRAGPRVDLIYLDPPFNSRANYKRSVTLRTADGPRVSVEHPQYSDTWTDDDYLQFMYERLSLCREVLGERGALFLHCDWHQSHRLRCVLDELFGPSMFQNEIVWHYYNKLQGNVGRFASNHDVILYYSKLPSFSFERIRERRERPVRQIERVWSKAKGSIVNAKGPDGKIRYVTSTHKTIDDVWRVAMLQPADRSEAVGYPTQKPEALLERILVAASRPGDLVLDPFMGSGTTAATALKLGRRFIGADLSASAVHLSTRRLLRIHQALAAAEPVTIKNGLDRAEPIEPRRGARLDVYGVGEHESTALEAELEIADGRLRILGFRSPALLEAFGPEHAPSWRALVDAVFIDPHHDGAILRPTILDIPGRGEQVRGEYELPSSFTTVAVRIVDLLGHAWTGRLGMG